MKMKCSIHHTLMKDGFCEDCLSAVSSVSSKPLLAAKTKADLRDENKRLAQMLLCYGDHCRPCNKWYNAEGPCTCGWDSLEKALDAANVTNEAEEKQGEHK